MHNQNNVQAGDFFKITGKLEIKATNPDTLKVVSYKIIGNKYASGN